MTNHPEPIAIVGMGFRLPGASTVEQLWTLLDQGADLVGPVPTDRLQLLQGPDAPRWGAFLEDVAGFDASFFGMKGLEARFTDPALRLLLEVSWQAFEDAALDVSKLHSQTGVFVGAHTNDYHELAVRAGVEVNAYWNAGLNASVLANRLSYFYNFHGPSLTINTACSSSLEAMVWATTALRMGHCEQALVAGANLILTPTVGQGAARAGMLSPNGRCKTFSAAANGFVRGEGVAALLLKPLMRARAEGDRIQAVIRAARSAHGGRAASFTAPNLKRQRDLLIATYEEAGICPSSITCIEAHGTGTRLGDSVEVEALKEAFSYFPPTQRRQGYCGLGSIKTNLGHLEAASGLAGVIKMCLAMKYGKRPGLVHYQDLSPLITLSGSPFQPLTQSLAWPRSSLAPRRAGVSSFGFGGSIAHVLLEEGDELAENVLSGHEDCKQGAIQLVMLSARDPALLTQKAADLLHFLTCDLVQTQSLANVAHTLRVGRQAMAARMALVVADLDACRSKLKQFVEDGSLAEACFTGFVASTVKKDGRSMEGILDLSEQARLWVEGKTDAHSCQASTGQRLRLPTYPFAHKRYWITDT